MSLEMLWGEERKCSATVVGLDLVLALSKVRRCSLKQCFKRRLQDRFNERNRLSYSKYFMIIPLCLCYIQCGQSVL